MLKTKITSKGQLVIPQEVREMLNIKEGSQFEVQVQGGKIILTNLDFYSKLSSVRTKIKSKLAKKGKTKISDQEINKSKEELWHRGI